MAILRTNQVVIERVVGNVEPITATIIDQESNPVDVSGRTITYRVVNAKTDVLKGSGAGQVVDGPTGKVGFNPASGDVDTPGYYAIYFFTDATPARRAPYDGARYILHLKREGSSE